MASTRPRVFVDTNVFFSALYSKAGTPASLLQHHRDGQIEFVVSLDVLEELIRELSAKLPDAVQTLGYILAGSPPVVMGDPTAEEVDSAVTQVNPLDAPIWAAVLASECDYFVTGDRRFLKEARTARSDIVTLTPRELLERITT